jgi:hypothetical protein
LQHLVENSIIATELQLTARIFTAPRIVSPWYMRQHSSWSLVAQFGQLLYTRVILSGLQAAKDLARTTTVAVSVQSAARQILRKPRMTDGRNSN